MELNTGKYLSSGEATRHSGDPEPIGDKVYRELALVSTGLFYGAAEAADKAVRNPVQTAGLIGTGAGLGIAMETLMRGRGSLGGMIARTASAAFALGFAKDILINAGDLSTAVTDNWRSGANWDANQKVAKHTLGGFLFDSAVMGVGAGLGGSLVRSQARLPELGRFSMSKASDSGTSRRFVMAQVDAAVAASEVASLPALWESIAFDHGTAARQFFRTAGKDGSPLMRASHMDAFENLLQAELKRLPAQEAPIWKKLDAMSQDMQNLHRQLNDQVAPRMEIFEKRLGVTSETAEQMALSQLRKSRQFRDDEARLIGLMQHWEESTKPFVRPLSRVATFADQVGMPLSGVELLAFDGRGGAYACGTGVIGANPAKLGANRRAFMGTIYHEMVHAEQDYIIVRAVMDEVLGNNHFSARSANGMRQREAIKQRYEALTETTLEDDWLLKVAEKRNAQPPSERVLTDQQKERAYRLADAQKNYNPVADEFGRLESEFRAAERRWSLTEKKDEAATSDIVAMLSGLNRQRQQLYRDYYFNLSEHEAQSIGSYFELRSHHRANRNGSSQPMFRRNVLNRSLSDI